MHQILKTCCALPPKW